MILKKGRVCIIKKGRDFGKVCMVDSVKGHLAHVLGLNFKGDVNILHLYPIDAVVSSVDELKEKVKL